MCDAAKSGRAGESVLTETYDNIQKEAAGGNLTEDLPKQLQRSLLIGEWLQPCCCLDVLLTVGALEN